MTDLPLPDIAFSGQNLDELSIWPIESYRVCSWTPERDGQGKAIQVHLLLEVGDVTLAVRFKSPAALDQFIGSLTRHRFDVWPDQT